MPRLNYTCGFILGSDFFQKDNFILENASFSPEPADALISFLCTLMSHAVTLPMVHLNAHSYPPLLSMDLQSARLLGETISKSTIENIVIEPIEFKNIPSFIEGASKSTHLKELRIRVFAPFGGNSHLNDAVIINDIITKTPNGIPFVFSLFLMDHLCGVDANLTQQLIHHFGDKIKFIES